MPDDTQQVPSIDAAIDVLEKMHLNIAAGLTFCQLFELAHAAFHLIEAHGQRIAALAREGQRRVH